MSRHGKDEGTGYGDQDQGDHRVLGKIGRVTLPVEEGRFGEVMIPIRGGYEAYAATSEHQLSKNTQVVVVDDLGGRSVVVAPYP